MMFDEAKIRAALPASWSKDTARQWTADRPFEGQCNVTAAVIADLFGGEILKTPWNDVTDHYYNRVEGQTYDFTDAQFENPIHYEDALSFRDEASQGFSESEFNNLRDALVANLAKQV